MRSTEAGLHLSLAVTGPATIEMTDVGGIRNKQGRMQHGQLAGQIFQRFLTLLDETYRTQKIFEQDNKPSLVHLNRISF